MTSQLELLSPSVNFAVVQLPERHFPGVVFQGDTLHSFAQSIQEMERLLKDGDLNELHEEILQVKELLANATTRYEAVCMEREIPLPY
jgi:predicted RNase H-like HicB family nuclease